MDFKRRLPIPREIKEQMPLPFTLAREKSIRDAQIREIFTGTDKRKILIIGPCSADREDAVLEYCLRLARLQEEVSHELLIVPRVYTCKPRSSGVGYKGMMHRPDPALEDDLLAGIKAIRRIHLQVLTETGLSTADELLYPQQHRFVSDLLSYVAVGARSVENQEHRLVASGLDIPVGMKNPISGDLRSMVNAVYAAHQPQVFIYRNWEVESSGNEFSHCILRGYERDGQSVGNYHRENLFALFSLCCDHGLSYPSVIVDCNHSNSGKEFRLQEVIAEEVLDAISKEPSLNSFVKGFMIESYLEDGCQVQGPVSFGRSITDPCMGWEMTERVVKEIAQRMSVLTR